MRLVRRFPNLLLWTLLLAAVAAIVAPVAFAQRFPPFVSPTSAGLTCGGTPLSCASIPDTAVLYRSGATVVGSAAMTFTSNQVRLGTPETTAGELRLKLFDATNAGVLFRETGSNVEGTAYATTSRVELGSFTNHNVAIIANAVARATFAADGSTLTVTPVVLGPDGTSSAPTYSFTSDTNSGMASGGDGLISFYANATEGLRLSGTQVRGGGGGAAGPTFAFVGENDSGLYSGGDNDVRIGIGGAEKVRFTSTEVTAATGVFFHGSVTAGITASTTETQGQQPLTSEINEVSTATANDVVTAPAAVAGRCFKIANNGGATIQIFPASGDNLGGGVDTAVTLTNGTNREYCAYDATNWEVF